MARPSLGVRGALLFLLPGIGGRNKGAGDAIWTGVGAAGGRGEENRGAGIEGGVGGGSVKSATTGRRRRRPASFRGGEAIGQFGDSDRVCGDCREEARYVGVFYLSQAASGKDVCSECGG